jgi:8-oxo-dGTP pyrophosphatase MutT (NUDIX family)
MNRIEPKDRHKIIPASYLMLLDGDKVLLQRRFNTGYEDGNYSLPAGHVDAGESFTQAMVRETREEINIDIPQDVKVAHMAHRKSDDSERIDAFFVVKEWTGEIKNLEPNKCDDLSWFDMDDLPENTISFLKDIIPAIRDGKIYSEYGWSDR